MPSLKTSAQTTKLLAFFVLVAKGMNKREAGLKVGYSNKWANTYSSNYLKKFADYVQWLQAHFAQAVVTKIGIDQGRVLEEIESIAMANLHDYIVHEEVQETVKGKSVMVKRTRLKRLDELTKEQMRAVDPGSNGGPNSPLVWKFRDRDAKLTELAKTMGLLNEKVILEHRHRHLHVHTDLTKVPMDKLEALEAEYEEILALGHDKPDEGVKLPKRGNGTGH